MLSRLREAAALTDKDINLADPDAPLILDWSNAERGRFYRPVKRLKSFRIDADVLAFYEAQGRGYHTVVNGVLREAMVRHLQNAESDADLPKLPAKKA